MSNLAAMSKRFIYHDLAQYRKDKVLHLAVARVCDNVDQTDDSIGSCRFQEHCGDRDVWFSMVVAERFPGVVAHVEKTGDEKEREESVEGDRNGPVWQ